ncbi:MAG: serine--tRNA ligase [Mariprofundaceae bacterium]|nr:serine--tRNA ligase [Mariprofundaceae bacterium]
MIDRKAFRKDFEQMQQALARRDEGLVAKGSAWARAHALDTVQRDMKAQSEALQAERNRVSKLIGQKKRQGNDASEELARMSEVGKQSKQLDAEAKEAELAFSNALLEIPNPPHGSVPDGVDENDNIEIRRWGEPRQDDVPAHWDIGEALGILDFDAGVKLAGSRFSVLRGAAARLERALIQFMLDMHADQHHYEEVWVPAIANRKTLTGTGQLPKFEDDLYRLEGEDAFLIPTAEVPVTNLYQDNIINIADLPIKHCAYSPCFRREAGSAGRDTRGMIRQHQFDKVELVQLVHPDDALTALDELTQHAAAVLEALELPYRVVDLCAGDIGFSAQKTFDLEVWLPSHSCYREISSCSSFAQFQGRRAGIRFRTESGKPEAVATVNGSGLAIGRTLVAILENGWQIDENGNDFVVIPEKLRSYMGGLAKISAA